MTRAAATARLSIFSNTLLIAMKLVVGILSGSVSIISEAIHSLMDLAAAIMAFFSIRIASRPADEDHQYGHGKVENVSGVIEAALIVVAAGLIIWESIRKLITRGPLDHLELCVAVMAASGITNIIVSRRLYKVAREEQSVALAADALHLKTDVYTSLGVGVGLLIIAIIQWVFRAPWVVILDPIVAMVVAAFIIREAWEMLRHAFAPLVDAAIPAAEMDALKQSVALHSDVQIHDVRTRQAGRTRYIDFHLVVPESMSVKRSHELCDSMEHELAKTLPDANVLIHVEPKFSEEPSAVTGFSKDDIMSSLERMGHEVAGYNLRPHHLHIFEGPDGNEITFHVAMEPGATLEATHAMASALEAKVKERFNMTATVHVEPRREE